MTGGADRIIKRILADAQTRAEEIKVDAARIMESIDSEARQKAAHGKKQILDQARKDAEEQKRRIIGMAQLDIRKELLSAKQNLIGEAFERSLEQLSEMDERYYLTVMKDMLLDWVETGAETVICSNRDRDRIPSSFWKEINDDLIKNGKKGELTLSSETRDIKGGFILQAEGIEINCSFESLLEMKKDDLEPAVAAVLFS